MDRHPRSGEHGDEIVAFGPLAGRIGTAAGVLAVLAFVGVVIQGVQQGLSFGLMGRWGALWLIAVAFSAALLAAVHALGGANRAQRRGERLAGHDVGLWPSRRREPPPSGPGE